MRDLSNNQKFWKTIKPYFSNKGLNSNRLFLKEKGNLVSNEKQLANIMSNVCITITKDLELKEDNSSNPNTLKMFNAHSSAEKIRRNIKIREKTSFQQVIKDLVRKMFLNLDSFKATPVGDIPVDMLKSTTDTHFPITLEFQIEGKGGINGEGGKFQPKW